MKKLLIVLLFLSSTSFASVPLKDYNWDVTDVADLGLKKEDIFRKMDRSFIKLSSSICANRALMWLYDMKKEHEIDGAKIFLFYTEKTGGAGLRTWWYHVAPIIAEDNELYVVDAGFRSISHVLKVQDWVGTFSVGARCKEIKNDERDLIELMYKGQQFPVTTHYGTYDCYYKIVPAGIHYPKDVADSLLGKNVSFEIDKDDVYYACTEAVTDPLGRMLGLGKKKCRKYIEN